MSRLLGKTRETIGLKPGELPPQRLPALESAISDGYVARREAGQPAHRRYLGASDIGHACGRHVFYVYHHAKKADFSGQQLRLFETGHLQEERIEKDLRSVGVIVSTAAQDGGQHHFTDESGHFRVHLDGIIEPDGHWFNERVLLECKTMNATAYKKLEEEGVKRSKPEYYRQMMMQLWAARSLGVDKCLFIAVHKDTDKMYIELVHIDKDEQQAMIDRAGRIIAGKIDPPLESSENAPPCKYGSKGQCNFREICREDKLHLIEKNCRTCEYSRAAPRGQWICHAGHPFGTLCDDWLLKSEFQ